MPNVGTKIVPKEATLECVMNVMKDEATIKLMKEGEALKEELANFKLELSKNTLTQAVS
mgnify:CR=1 FL=1